MENNSQKYTHTPIHGKLPVKTMPKGTALVLEGGGTRGFYSAGVFEAFMEEGIMFPYIAGVSAGAANALTYIAGQPLRSRQIVEYYAGTPQYVGFRNLIFRGSMFNIELVFRTIPQKHIFFDWDTFNKCKTQFYTGTMNCATGKTEWFSKEHICPEMSVTIASCAVPLMAPIVKYKGFELLDGGISDPIPIEKSLADGNDFHVIVLTQNKGYVKKPFGHEKFIRRHFRKHPEVAEAMLRRHEIYNRQLALCEELEAHGKAIIIRPLEPLKVGRTTADTKALLTLYDEGHKESRAKIPELLSHIGGTI